ncbi:hypothetical protein [Mycolicibacterium elephantis]|uniref:hypothetical protein n=1 Tax=Mycolicibacterium elephantis TaxID=81858 RepID=UPI000A41BA3E|nr:hypothetical protein [Mycolicibacterium elephantis]
MVRPHALASVVGRRRAGTTVTPRPKVAPDLDGDGGSAKPVEHVEPAAGQGGVTSVGQGKRCFVRHRKPLELIGRRFELPVQEEPIRLRDTDSIDIGICPMQPHRQFAAGIVEALDVTAIEDRAAFGETVVGSFGEPGPFGDHRRGERGKRVATAA